MASACAFLVSSRLRDSWKASVRCAPAVDLDHPAPDRAGAVAQNAAEGEVRGRVRRGVLLERVEVEVLAPARRICTGDGPARALARELGLEEHLAVRRAEAERDPVERAVALDDGPLRAEYERALGERLRIHEAQVGVLADYEFHDAVDEAVGVGVARQRLMPHLRLGALLEHDQRAVVKSAAGPLMHCRQHDRRLNVKAARDVDERAIAPARVVLRGQPGACRDDASQVVLDEIGMTLRRNGERHHDRPLRQCLLSARAHGDIQVKVEYVLGTVSRATRRRGVRVEVERPERSELPPRLALELRQRQPRRLGGSGLTALR